MKNLVFVFVTMLLSMHVSGQDPVNDVFDQYAGKEGFTTVNITGELFKMLIEMDKSCKHQKNLSTQINEIKILAQEEGDKIIKQAQLSIEGEKKAAIADIKSQVASLSVRVTRLARGLPAGSTITQVSRSILADAVEGRRPI